VVTSPPPPASTAKRVASWRTLDVVEMAGEWLEHHHFPESAYRKALAVSLARSWQASSGIAHGLMWPARVHG
jgi:hypothetical protein